MTDKWAWPVFIQRTAKKLSKHQTSKKENDPLSNKTYQHNRAAAPSSSNIKTSSIVQLLSDQTPLMDELKIHMTLKQMLPPKTPDSTKFANQLCLFLFRDTTTSSAVR